MTQNASQRDSKKYKDEEWLRKEYVEKDRTLQELAKECSVSGSTICQWARKYGLGKRQREHDLSDLTIPDSEPWKDPDLLEELYYNRKLSTTEISNIFECSVNTVTSWMETYGMERRSASQAKSNAHGYLDHASFRTKKNGREIWKVGDHSILVYRLLAVSEWGLDEVSKYDVHHKNGIEWDNRIENLELVTNSEHRKRHRDIDGIDRLRIAEMYEHGTASSRELGAILDISNASVLRIHKEFYGE